MSTSMSTLTHTKQLQLLLPSGEMEVIALDDAPERFVIGPNPACYVATPMPFSTDMPFVGIEKDGAYVNVFQLPARNRQRDQEPKPTRLQANDAVEVGAAMLMYVLLDQSATPYRASEAQLRHKPVAPVETQTPTQLVRFETRPPDKISPLCNLDLGQRLQVVDLDQTATFDVMLANTSSQTQTFDVGMMGLPTEWARVTPSEAILRPGDSIFVRVAITPERQSEFHAGDHHFVVAASTKAADGPRIEAGATLRLNAYTNYALSPLRPNQIVIPWRAKSQAATFTLQNLGNDTQTFRLEAYMEDTSCQCVLELPDFSQRFAKQAELTLKPHQSAKVKVSLNPLRRQTVQWDVPISTLTINAQAIGSGQPQSTLNASVSVRPMLGRALLSLFAVMVIIAGIFISRPQIRQFEVDRTVIVAGDKVTLSWHAGAFTRLRLQPEDQVLLGSRGTVQIQPEADTRYMLVAENALSDIAPGIFGDQQQVTVYVDGTLPSVGFFSDLESVIANQPVNLWWEVDNATRVTLTANGVVEEINVSEHNGSRLLMPSETTSYVLRAYNRFTSEEGVVASKTIVVDGVVSGASSVVQQSDQAPQPAVSGVGPTIDMFTVTPSSITAGQRVELNWRVSGAESVTIRPVGALASTGSLIQMPQQSTAYILTASDGVREVQLVRQVIVQPRVGNSVPAQSPEDPPESNADSEQSEDAEDVDLDTRDEDEEDILVGQCVDPLILEFTATPDLFIKSNQSQEVTLNWLIDGETTNVELRGPVIGKIDGLSNEDTWVTLLDTSTSITLIAEDGTCRASETLKIRQDIPDPEITNLSVEKAFVEPKSLTILVSGNGFTPDSIVRWNNSPRETRYLSENSLSVDIPAADFTRTGIGEVTVYTPGAIRASSNMLPVAIENPMPQISGLSPSQIDISPTPTPDPAVTPVASSGGTITQTVRVKLIGTGFVPGSVIRIEGGDRVGEYVSPTEMFLPLTAADLERKVLNIDIWNPTPGGGESNVVQLEIRVQP